MCYSAQIEAEYNKYARETGAKLSIQEYVRLFHSNDKKRPRIPRAIELELLRMAPSDGDVREVQRLIREQDALQIAALEQDLFKQRKRLADAERSLQVKTTKKALDDKRIATDKVAWALGKLGDLRRTEVKPKDARIFPGWYAPVLLWEDGGYVIKPMRYQCRPAGKPAVYDTRYPGTYNARRDNLEGFWKGQFGHTHGLLIATRFYENVERHDAGRAPYKAVLEFAPRGLDRMLVACLWSEWRQGDERLLSFAAITDEPPAEVAAAGHDRCIIPIRPENLAAWLRPDPRDLGASYAILDDRERPYYEHRIAA